MSIEILVRPAVIVPVLKSGSDAPETASQEEEAILDWGAGPLGTPEVGDSSFYGDGGGGSSGGLGGGYSPLPYGGVDYGEVAFVGAGVYSDWDAYEAATDPDNPENAGKVLPPKNQFTEMARKTHTIRVTQPGKPENYVDVEVIDRIAFRGPDGIYEYTFNNRK